MSDNSCHLDTNLTVVPELRGVLQLPELHARYATAYYVQCEHVGI